MKFHELNDNPGLFPQKLGNAVNQVSSWKFIQIFDLEIIITEYNKLKTAYEKINKMKQNNVTREQYKIEFLNI